MSSLTWRYSGLDRYGFDRNDFEREKRRLVAEGVHEPQEKDVLWALWNRALEEHSQLHAKSGIYYQMAIFRSEEGEDPAPMLTESRRAELRKMIRDREQMGMDPPVVEILAAGNGCDSCLAANGTTLPAPEALETMPLPNPDCTHGLHEGSPPFCRCSYGVHHPELS